MRDNKKTLVTGLLLIALITLVVGITFTALSYTKSSNDNSVTTGRISMSYSEPSNALELINALPMSDEEGLAQTNYFEFTVSSLATTNTSDNEGVIIPYEINLSEIDIDADKTKLSKDKIKVSLTKVVDAEEVISIDPILLSDLSNSLLNDGSIKVYDTKDIYKNNSSSITTRYRLRTWIDKSFELDNTLTYQYKFKVNVNSYTPSLSVLVVDKIKVEYFINDTWQEVTDNITLKENDKIKITFIYNKNISGDTPTLSLNVGDNTSKGVISKGAIVDNKLTYLYTVSKEDKGQIKINDLAGGSIKDEYGNSALNLTEDNKNSIKINVETPPTFSETLTKSVITSGDGLYKTLDTNDGSPSYYYKGNVENNYVKLPEKDGDALYRIVRINEDGSVRLIRDQGINGNTNYQFNPNYNNYSYMYYSNSNVTNGIMKRVNDWYASVIDGTKLDGKVVDSDFCEQAKVKYSSSWTSGSAAMEIASKVYQANLKCEIDGNGKGLLNMKIGLITLDELVMAGIPLSYAGITKAEYNTNTYLQMNGTGWYFWTMSPAGFYSGDSASAWYVNSSGFVYDTNVNYNYRIRPVFSLASDIEMTGKGTETEPYEPILQSN